MVARLAVTQAVRVAAAAGRVAVAAAPRRAVGAVLALVANWVIKGRIVYKTWPFDHFSLRKLWIG